MAEARNRKSGNSRFDRKNFSGDSKKRGIKGDERKGFKSESAKRGFYGAPVKNTEFENLEMVNAVPEESDKLEGRNSVMEL